MGEDHHYTPKHYLKGFLNNEKKNIWTYEKGSDRIFPASLNKIGYQVNFYTPGKEKYLANEIENPANKILSKIRCKESISKSEKEILTDYLVVFLQRVPASFDRFKSYAVNALKEEEENLKKQIDIFKKENPNKEDFYDQRKEQIVEIIEEFRSDPPRKSWVNYINPNSLPQVREAILKKTWQFLCFDFIPAYISSDNPVFFFRGLGLANKFSELVFPISSNIALWATWRTDFNDLHYSNVSSNVVNEINNRIASSATRHIFFPDRKTWVSELAQNEDFSFKRIV